jgi:type VI secretion system protein VasG
MVKALKPELNNTFKPAFLGRMVIIPYFPILDDSMKQIIRLKLGKIERRLMETHKVNLQYDEAMVDEVAQRCTEVESGARNVDNILTNTLLPEISIRLLESLADGAKPSAVTVSVGEGGAFQYSTEPTG